MPHLRRTQDSRRSLRHLRRVGLLTLLVLLALGVVPTSAKAARFGTITGRIINGNTEKGQPGVRVTLLGGRSDDAGNVTQELDRSSVTGKDGRFSFDGLPTGEDRPYALDAHYSGGLFSGDVIALPSDTGRRPVIESTLRVWPTTADPNAIVIERDDLFVIKGQEGDINVVESLKVLNITTRAYIGRGGSMGAAEGPRPSLGLSVPQQALSGGIQIQDSTIEIPQLIRTSTGPAITSAIPPGATSISFLYRLEGTAGQFDLSRRAFYPTLELTVSAEPPFVVDSPGMEEGDELTIEGRRYRQWSVEQGLEPGDSIQILAVARAEGDSVLIVGAGALGLVIVTATAFAVARRRSRREAAGLPRPERPAAPLAPPRPRPDAPVQPALTRNELLVAIAELDLRYRSGKLNEEEWVTRRTKLKSRLATLPSTRDAGDGQRGTPEPAS